MRNHPLLALAAAASLLIAPELLHAQDGTTTAATTTTEPSPLAFLSSYFGYARPDEIVVEETTPTPDQINFRGRPRQLTDDEVAAARIVATDKPAKPKRIGEIDIRRLRFKDADGDIVTALLCTPADKAGPFPLAIAVHGLGSNKAQVCGQVAPALAKKGFAVLAPDMPVHGERPGSPWELQQNKDWLRAIQLHRRAIIDIRQCIDLAEKRPELDLSKGVILAGYSMGSWLDSVAGPLDERVRAMVFMVGGAHDLSRVAPLLKALPQIAAANPLTALPQFAGRPLLMLNGRNDPIVTPDMAERLYDAAAEPKSQKWYDSGHLLPPKAYQDAADWIASMWTSLPNPIALRVARSTRQLNPVTSSGAMFPLAGKDFPTTADALAESIAAALAELFTLKGDKRHVVIIEGGETYPSLRNMTINLDGAVVRATKPPPKPIPTGNRHPGPRVEKFHLSATPIQYDQSRLNLVLAATDLQFAFDRDTHGEPLLVLAAARDGTVNARIAKADLEKLVTEAASVAAQQQGIKIQDLDLDLREVGPRAIAANVRVKAKKLMMSGTIHLTARLDIDDALNATVSNLDCTGEGLLAAAAAGIVKKKLTPYDGTIIPLMTFSLGDFKLRNLKIDVTNDLHLTAAFGA